MRGCCRGRCRGRCHALDLPRSPRWLSPCSTTLCHLHVAPSQPCGRTHPCFHSRESCTPRSRLPHGRCASRAASGCRPVASMASCARGDASSLTLRFDAARGPCPDLMRYANRGASHTRGASEPIPRVRPWARCGRAATGEVWMAVDGAGYDDRPVQVFRDAAARCGVGPGFFKVALMSSRAKAWQRQIRAGLPTHTAQQRTSTAWH